MKRSVPVQRIIWVVIACALAAFVVGCAPQQDGGDQGGAADKGSSGGDAIQMAWSPDMDCATCHTAENDTMSKAGMGAEVHVTEAQTTCSTCHTDTSGLTKVHEGKTASDTMPKKLKKTEVGVDACQNATCHNLSQDEMLALTANDTQLIDSNGTHVNPHDVIGKTPGHADITCSNCHNMHKDSVTAADTCVACHHSGVYECGTCH